MDELIKSIYDLPIDQLILVLFVIFCRIGACLMVIPGFGSSHVAVQVRLFMAIAFSFAIVSLIDNQIVPLINNITIANLALLLGSEFLIGILMGMVVRVFFEAMQFIMTVAGQMIGLGSQMQINVIDGTAESLFGNIITVIGLAIFFASDLHLLVLKGLVSSYHSFKPIFGFNSQVALNDYTKAISSCFWTLLRVGSPFIVYSIIINIAVGLLSRLTPTVPVYFISTALTILGGILLIYFMLPHILDFFSGEFANWINQQFG